VARPAYVFRVKLVAESYAWPFRGHWRSRWAPGILCIFVLPLLFIPLLGYAIAATRAAEADPSTGPPSWRLSARLLSDGLWTACAVLLTMLPFLLAWHPLAGVLMRAGASPSHDAWLAGVYAHAFAFSGLALPWGLVALLVLPHATASFAASGRPGDLFNLAAALKKRRDVHQAVVGAVSVTVSFDPDLISHDALGAAIRRLATKRPPIEEPGRLHRIPVVYDGPDLNQVASSLGVTPRQVIE